MDAWMSIALVMLLLNFALGLRTVLTTRWMQHKIAHIEFHVCPDHEEWEEVRERIHGALEAHLEGLKETEQLHKSQMTIEEWDNL